MISFEGFKTEEGTPVYQQILLYIKRGAVAGVIKDGDDLPSRRVLSALLGINPHTVQKAFRLLEEEGLIESRLGAGSVMVLSDERVAQLRAELLTDDIRGITRALKLTGVSRAEALELIDRYQPKVMLHGHVHLNYGYRISDEARRGDTRILNAWQARVIEMG